MLSDRNLMLCCLAVGNLNNGVLRIFVRRFADLEMPYYLCSLVEAYFSLVGLQLFPLGGAKNHSVTQNSEFSFPISYNSMPLLPNNLLLLRNTRALSKNNLTT